MSAAAFPIIFLMGPTASGKTQLAVELVRHFPCEIISVDSAMVYREMDIGTSKPTLSQLKIAPHRLINLLDPKEPYSAGRFRKDVLIEIEEIKSKGKVPLLVGGTMMYFRVLQQGLAPLPASDPKVRAALQEKAQLKGWKGLHDELGAIDPIAAARIHYNDSQRIQRALEVYHLTGRTLTSWQRENTHPLAQYKIHPLCIAPSQRTYLHEQIANRFHHMIELGFIDEVQNLFHRGDLSEDMPSIRTVGYRQMWDYLSGRSSFDEMCVKAITATRQLAKHQLTWLRAWPNLTWFDSEVQGFAAEVIDQMRKIIE